MKRMDEVRLSVPNTFSGTSNLNDRLKACLPKALEIKWLWDETKILKEFLRFRQKSENLGYLPLSALFTQI